MKCSLECCERDRRRVKDIAARRERRFSWLYSFATLATVALPAAFLTISARSVAVAQERPTAGQSTKASTKADNAQSGSAKNGRAIYAADGCYECHGREAQGGAGTGPRLGPSPIPFPAFVYQVRTPRDQMPPYTSKVLSDAELADIYAFVQSLPQPQKVDSIPQLK
jgi:mono/diheme cytochrome c family protein